MIPAIKRAWERYIDGHWGLALTLILLGGLLLWQVLPGRKLHSFQEFLQPVGEALIIAGALALVVDRPLKNRLVKEAEKGLFVHMLGYDLPQDVKKKLSEIAFGTDLHIPEKTIRCQIVRFSDHFVKVSLEESYQVINPTNRNIEYRHEVVFELCEYPSDAHITAFIGDDVHEDSTISRHDPGTDLVTVGPRIVRIPAKSSARFQRCYSMVRSLEGFQELFQSLPVLKVVLTISHDDGLYVNAGTPTIRSANVFVYDFLLMPGDKISIRWWPSARSEVLLSPKPTLPILPPPQA